MIDEATGASTPLPASYDPPVVPPRHDLAFAPAAAAPAAEDVYATDTLIRPSDEDAYSHVNNATFFLLFHDHRTQRAADGLPGGPREGDAGLLDLRRVRLEYMAPVHAGEVVRIESRVEMRGGAEVLEMTMLRPGGMAAARCGMVVGDGPGDGY